MSTSPTATVTVTDELGPYISPYTFGGMIEHFGRTVEPGVWDSKRDIPRADTKAAIESMGVTMIRWPGGCFSDTYHWRDGVGPKDKRPLRQETFWTTVTTRLGGGFGTSSSFARTPEDVGKLIGPPEPNLLGTDEFLQYCLDVDAEPFLVVNLGSGDAQEAADWVRYCNVDKKSPRRVTYWSVGNETWGKHEYSHAPPEEYGRRVVEYAKAMKAVDPSIKIVAVGLGMQKEGGTMFDDDGTGLSGYSAKAWNDGVFKAAGDHLDLLSVHWYFPGLMARRLTSIDDLKQLCTAPHLLQESFDFTIKYIDSKVTNRQVDISFDEWNRMVVFDDHLMCNHPLGNAAFFAGCYNALINYTERVPLAIISHLVNCLAPIQTDNDRIFGTVSYLVAKVYAKYAKGQRRGVHVDSPLMDVPALADHGGRGIPLARKPRKAQVITATATTGGLFIVNSDPEYEHRVEVKGWRGGAKVQWITSGNGLDVWAENSLDHPDNLRFVSEIVAGTELTITIPRAGFLVVSAV